MYGKTKGIFGKILADIRESGLYKEERILLSPQGAKIKVPGKEVINFCANNYLGLANHPELIKTAKKTLDEFGYGLSSVRFICGTQSIHKELEKEISTFLGMDDTILYTSCFDANGGLFETILDEECAIISDELNHASIIDGIRLCRAKRYIFKHGEISDLEAKLKEAANHKIRMIATDGVFSMDGDIANLPAICELAERYDALVMVDDSHATGFFGEGGRGTPEYHKVEGRVDIITSTLGKALGGATGGFTSGRKEIVDLLRQRSRPYLFSNSVPPVVAAAGIAAIRMLKETGALRNKLRDNTSYFREELKKRGFNIKESEHPIIPIMLGEAKLAQDMARDLLTEGIYVIGFSYPVVPKGQARIRVQISAAHEREHLDKALNAFAKVGANYRVV
jgi:glycine C-acetyltransferase